jgi:hypothetical protein
VFTALRPLKASAANAGEGDTAGSYAAEYRNLAGSTGSTTAFAYALCMSMK